MEIEKKRREFGTYAKYRESENFIDLWHIWELSYEDYDTEYDNFVEYCASYYDNPQCHGDEEFYDDLMRLKYIKKLCTRYAVSGELKERLILNHIIVLSNTFAPKALCKIIWLKMQKREEITYYAGCMKYKFNFLSLLIMQEDWD